MTQPIRVLQVFSILNRGGGETMIMNYYRHIDRSRVQFDFLVHREEPGAYEEEIKTLGGRIFRIPPITSPVRHARAVRAFFDDHPEFRIIHGHVSELGYFIYREAAKRHVPCIIAHAHNARCSLDLKWPFRALLKRLIRSYISCGMTCGLDAARWPSSALVASPPPASNSTPLWFWILPPTTNTATHASATTIA